MKLNELIDELNSLEVVIDGKITTPSYRTTVEILESGERDYSYTITATAQEVYQEWLQQQNNHVPAPISLEERILHLEIEEVNRKSREIENQILGGQI